MNFLQFIIAFMFTKYEKRILNFLEFVKQSDCFDKKHQINKQSAALFLFLKT